MTSVFGLKSKDVKLINHYVGGAFGSGLRPQHQLFFAVMASLELKRSVRVSLTRTQMFHIGYRPDNFQSVSLAADRQGRLQAIIHDAVASTSHYEDHQEAVVNWSGMMYHCDNVKLSYRLAKLDTATPCDMRAPGAAIGVTALDVRTGRTFLRGRHRPTRDPAVEFFIQGREYQQAVYVQGSPLLLSARRCGVRLAKAKTGSAVDAAGA